MSCNNNNSLIGKLLIGSLDTSSSSSKPADGFAVPAPRMPSKQTVTAQAARNSTLGTTTATGAKRNDDDDDDNNESDEEEELWGN